MTKLIKVLVVDDSAVVRDFLVYVLSSEPDMHVVGTAKNGKEAVQLVERKNPDIITMDINMPVMDGLTATRSIMESSPRPIVIVTSSYDKSEVDKTFNALDAGALSILSKPVGYNHPDYEKTRKELVTTVRMMAEVKVVTRRSKYKKSTSAEEKLPMITFDEKKTRFKVVAIGVSTGGPQVLNQILPLIPENFTLPIVIVQHISEGFLEGMINWLQTNCQLPIKIAKDGEFLNPATIYFCPVEYHIGITKHLKVKLTDNALDYGVKPSVSFLFRSISKSFQHEAIGVLLTGMGKDGSEELALMKEKGAVTIVQDQKSSVVYGMPGEAVKLNAQKYILSPENIAKKLVELNENING